MLKTKKKFSMPHTLMLVLCLIIFVCLLTYVIPAGQFVVNEAGVSEYTRVDQTPVSLIDMLFMFYNGAKNSGGVIALLLLIGAGTTLIMGTKSFENILDYCLYRLQDKGAVVLLPAIFMLFGVVGAFAGESVVAIWPLAVLLTKRLRLDPMTAAGLTLLSYGIGWATSPTSCFVAQTLLGVPMYSGFIVRFINMMVCLAIGAVFVTLYGLRVKKNAQRSILGDTQWLEEIDRESGSYSIEAKTLDKRSLLIVVLYFAQYALSIYLSLALGLGLSAIIGILIPVSILCGLLSRKSFKEMGDLFDLGAKNMGPVCLLIGLAGSISLVMSEGQIIATIAYYGTLPLKSLGESVVAVGLSVVISFINLLIPSASAKAAVLVPIIQPMAEALGIAPQIAAQVYQVGDGFTNMVTPINALTMVGLTMADVPLRKWLKWLIPIGVVFYIVEFIVLILVSQYGVAIGWA